MHTFTELAERLQAWNNEQEFGLTHANVTHRILKSLGDYLRDHELPFTQHSAAEWKDTREGRELAARVRGVDITVARLLDIDRFDDILPWHRPTRTMPLLTQHRRLVESFMSSLSGQISRKFIESHEAFSTRFLYLAQSNGAMKPAEVTYAHSRLFGEMACDEWPRPLQTGTTAVRIAGDLMRHAFVTGQASSPGPALLLHLIARRPDAVDLIEQNGTAKPGFSKEYRPNVRIVWTTILDILKTLRECHYARPSLECADHALKLFWLFLDYNHLSWSREISNWWLERSGFLFRTNWKDARRWLLVLGDCLEKREIVLIASHKMKPTRGSELPAWCKEEISRFVKEREKAGFAASTVANDRNAVETLCAFLVSKGIMNFGEIDSTILKDFNRADEHRSNEGKATYNSAVRRFLAHLEQRGLSSHPHLDLALPSIPAPSQKIVVTYTAGEMNQIREMVTCARTPVELRDAACMLLSTELGLRASDIAALKLTDINWEKQSVRLVQVKTGTEIELPLSGAAGNALYRYLKDGRPRCRIDEHVFLSLKAPYAPMTATACAYAVKRLLPERHVPGAGFHCGRKTYASERLKNSVTPDLIASLLGHAARNTLEPYLSLDEDRMKLCPLTLTELGISGTGGSDA